MENRHVLTLCLLAAFGAMLPLGSARAAETTISARASVVKSLTLTKKQDLDFGTVTLSGASGTYTVAISQAGVLSCPAGATCAGAPKQGIMNVQGSNRATVRIVVASTNLTNSLDGTQIPFTPNAPATLFIPNSGFPGVDFNIGGSIAIPSTADGNYAANVSVTVEYQ